MSGREPVFPHRVELAEPGLPPTSVAELPSAHTAVASVYVAAGPEREPQQLNGISHLLEHVLLAGSRAHPTRAELQRAFDQLGCSLAAYTHREYTEYTVQCFGDQLEPVLGLLGEALSHPLISREGVASEREIVLEELLSGSYEGAGDPFGALLWGSAALGQPIIGRREVLQGLGVEQLRDWHRRCYHAGNLVLSVAGGIGVEQVRRGLEGFAGLATDGDSPAPLPVSRSTGPSYQLGYARPLGSASLFLVFRTPGWDEADTARHTRLQLLVQLLQAELGLAFGPELPVYYVHAGQEVFVSRGWVYLALTARRPSFVAALERLLGLVAGLCERPPDAQRLEIHKRRYRLRLLAQLDDPLALAARLGVDRLLCGRERAVDPQLELEQLEALEPEQLAAELRQTLAGERLQVLGWLAWGQRRRVRGMLEAAFGVAG